MNSREQRGVVIAALCKLTPTDEQWVVLSQSGPDRRYVVNAEKGTCTCPDHVETGFKCKHVWAVEFTMKRECTADGTIAETRTMVFTEKKVYRQDWPAYNEAQSTEKTRVQKLLSDLCRGLSQPRTGKKGRPATLRSDMAFAARNEVFVAQRTSAFAARGKVDHSKLPRRVARAPALHRRGLRAFTLVHRSPSGLESEKGGAAGRPGRAGTGRNRIGRNEIEVAGCPICLGKAGVGGC